MSKTTKLIERTLIAHGATNVRVEPANKTIRVRFTMLGAEWVWNTACTPSVEPTAEYIRNYAKKAMLPTAQFKGVEQAAILAAFKH